MPLFRLVPINKYSYFRCIIPLELVVIVLLESHLHNESITILGFISLLNGTIEIRNGGLLAVPRDLFFAKASSLFVDLICLAL